MYHYIKEKNNENKTHKKENKNLYENLKSEIPKENNFNKKNN